MNVFAYEYNGKPFEFLGIAHITALLLIVLLNLYLLRFRKAEEETRRKVRLWMVIVLYTAEISWHLWNIAHGTWRIEER